MADAELIGLGLLVLAALAGAVYGTVIKLASDRLILMAGLNLITVAVGFILLPFGGVQVDAAAVPYLISAALLYNLMLVWLIKSYAANDLSRLSPLVTGIRIAVLTGLTLWFTSESAGVVETIALLVLLAGFIVQVHYRELTDPHNRTAICYCLITGIISGCQFYADFQGIKLSGNPYGFIVLTLFYGLPVAVYGLWRRRRSLRQAFQSEGGRMAAGAMLDIISYSLLLYAVYGLKVVQALPASNLSIVFSTIIGLWFLKERYAVRRLTASVLIFASVVLMQLA